MFIIFISLITVTVVAQQKYGVDSTNGLFSNGEPKKLKDTTARLENVILKSKIEVLGEVLKKHFNKLLGYEKHHKVELVFLVDASSSVGSENFQSELHFVRKLLADFSVSYNETRVALIKFSSIGQVVREVDLMSQPNEEFEKCQVLHHQVKYSGGGTYTLGAMLEAQDIFSHTRPHSRKALFLVTDGFSNGGDPRNVARALKSDGVTLFTFGVRNGNTAELFEMASTPGEEHSYILDSFDEFVALARRALHRDLTAGEYLPVSDKGQCPGGCTAPARCACGLRSGQYQCLCPPGHYGPGTAHQQEPCLPCPNGTYHNGEVPGDVTMCTPCPDINHITFQPAIGLHDCVCKQGFIAKGFSCEMVRCPSLKAPRHGLFVRGWCNNVVNAGCGLRCKVGYSLIGSSVRLCQQDGKWSGKPPKCVVKRCPRLQPPNNGILTCSPKINDEEGFPVDAECKFSCHVGSHLVGSPVRTCLPLARWDGLPTTCKSIKCLALPKVQNGIWYPAECMTNRKLPFGQICYLKCNLGFEREGPESRECHSKGSWTHKNYVIKCIDSMPPTIKCPANITTATDQGVGFAAVTWAVPEPQDNSNQPLLLWSDPATDLPMKLPIGITHIRYTATDSSYNQADCEFSITVIDNEPPTVEDCDSPSPYYVTENTRNNVSWDYPVFSDNSMENPFVNASNDLRSLPIGTTEVTFTAFDSAGNSNTCLIKYVLIDNGCKLLPPHTIANCMDDTCTISCTKGFMFVSGNSTVNVPYPCEESTLPECSETEEPNVLVQEGIFSLTPMSTELCNDSHFLNQVKSSVKSSLSETCSECSIDVEARCEDIIESVEEQSNQVMGRKKRSLPNRNINVVFKLSGQLGSESIEERLTVSMITNTSRGISKKAQLNLNLKTPYYKCPLGSVNRRNHCVKCPAGTYCKEDKNECVSCVFGTYQPHAGQLQCLSCPINTSTRKMHAKHAHACREICPAGTFSRGGGRQNAVRVGVRPCLACPVGWFQPLVGALFCHRCPNNKTTLRRRTVLADDCYFPNSLTICHPNFCHNRGTCFSKDNKLTCTCPYNFIGPRCEIKRDECLSSPCLNGGTCVNTVAGHECSCAKGFTGTDCQVDFDECTSQPCLNGGECTDLINSFICHCPPAFQGELCSEDVDDCQPEPCANGSSCVDLVGNYSCVCSSGFSGRHCELDPCLDTALCQHNGTCYFSFDSSLQSYWCECEGSWEGRHCEISVDPCLSNPCLHNATCLGPPPTCTCPLGYSGKHCQIIMPSNFTLFFPTSGTLNYVKLEEPFSDINQFTLCLWTQTEDRLNYATIFSYATVTNDNALTLTDYNGFVLYINGQCVITDITANDGVWHHICVEWTSLNGSWSIYKDGILRENGFGLSNDTLIQGKGIIVLGQDQDRYGGGFNAAESLVGSLTQVNVWNYNLGPELINHLANSCQAKEEGNLIRWNQFYSGIKGNVQIENITFCQGCSTISTPPHAQVEISDLGGVATYTCDPGYTFNYYSPNEVTEVQRKCLIDGKWGGQSPVCNKRSCGFPGYFPTGWIVGRSYLFENEIEYVCQYKFRLVGNKIRRCLENGTWSGKTPSCQGGNCSDLANPENGEMWGTYDNGFKMEFECRPGFEIQGKDAIVCLPNNTWSDEPPHCLPITCTFSTNLTVTVGESEDGNAGGRRKYGLGTEVQVTCPIGYYTDQEPLNTTCTESGWVPPSQSLACTPVTCPLLEVNNGSVTYEEINPLNYGSKKIIKCDKGFKLSGSSEIRCLENGDWDSISKCEKVICLEISTKHLTLPSSEYGKIATIQCPAEMVLLANGRPVPEQEVRWECGADGNWRNLTHTPVDPHILDCAKSPHQATCSHPQGPPHGYIVPDNQNITYYHVGHKLHVQCGHGYIRDGENFIICKLDGSWTNTTICRAVDCGALPETAFTKPNAVTNTKFGSVMKLSCNDGYQAYGDMSLRCQANQKWTRFRGRCVRISCGKPLLEEGVTAFGDSYLYLEKLKIVCQDGHPENGTEYITCEKNGSWSYIPKCKVE